MVNDLNDVLPPTDKVANLEKLLPIPKGNHPEESEEEAARVDKK